MIKEWEQEWKVSQKVYKNDNNGKIQNAIKLIKS